MANQLHTGAGRLAVEGEDCGPVVYSFSIGPDANPRGVLSNNGKFIRAPVNGVAHLILDCGKVVRIQIYEANKVRALFKLDGPELFELLDEAVSAAPRVDSTL